jgi:hypothetical protein
MAMEVKADRAGDRLQPFEISFAARKARRNSIAPTAQRSELSCIGKLAREQRLRGRVRPERNSLVSKLAKKALGKEKGRGQTSAAAAARQIQYPCHGREKRRTASEKEKRSEYASSLLLRHSFCAASPLTIAKTNPT